MPENPYQPPKERYDIGRTALALAIFTALVALFFAMIAGVIG